MLDLGESRSLLPVTKDEYPQWPAIIQPMPQKQPVNPFYSALVVVGVLFALTACAYGVMTVRGLEPQNADEGGLVGFLDAYGVWIMVGELLVLGILTVAAIGTDEYWTRRLPAVGADEVPRDEQRRN